MLQFNERQYIANLTSLTERRFDYRKALETGNWDEWRTSFRSRLAELTGLNLIRRDAAATALNPRRLETAALPDGSIREKWLVQTEHGIDIPFYLLLPRDGNGPFPLVLVPHGHGRRGKEVYVGHYESKEEAEEALAGDRDIALQAVKEGYAVIAPDVRGFWEMASPEDVASKYGNSCREFQRIAMMFGRTLIGERIHDMGRLIDFAETNGAIDTSRIVIAGNSGGGTVALFTAAMDERISIAVPGSYFCTFAASIIPLTHCPCNIVPGILGLGEMYDIAGLIAPRPMLAVHGAHDPIYPVKGTQEAFSHVSRIYDAHGASGRCELYVGEGGHRFYKDRVWSFIAEHLKSADE